MYSGRNGPAVHRWTVCARRRLGRQWLGEGGPAVALIQGLAGLGKTALAAEAIHLWHEHFDYVLAFQARPTALQLNDLPFGSGLCSHDCREPGPYRMRVSAMHLAVVHALQRL